MNAKIRLWIPELVSPLFVLLFLYTALNKLQYFDGFVESIDRNPLLRAFENELAVAILVSEFSITALLIIPVTRRLGLLLATLLMLCFTIYIWYMLATASHLPCTCGGIFNDMLWKDHLWFNSTFVILGTLSTIIYPKPFIAINRSRRTPEENSRQTIIN